MKEEAGQTKLDLVYVPLHTEDLKARTTTAEMRISTPAMLQEERDKQNAKECRVCKKQEYMNMLDSLRAEAAAEDMSHLITRQCFDMNYWLEGMAVRVIQSGKNLDRIHANGIVVQVTPLVLTIRYWDEAVRGLEDDDILVSDMTSGEIHVTVLEQP